MTILLDGDQHNITEYIDNRSSITENYYGVVHSKKDLLTLQRVYICCMLYVVFTSRRKGMSHYSEARHAFVQLCMYAGGAHLAGPGSRMNHRATWRGPLLWPMTMLGSADLASAVRHHQVSIPSPLYSVLQSRDILCGAHRVSTE